MTVAFYHWYLVSRLSTRLVPTVWLLLGCSSTAGDLMKVSWFWGSAQQLSAGCRWWWVLYSAAGLAHHREKSHEFESQESPACRSSGDTCVSDTWRRINRTHAALVTRYSNVTQNWWSFNKFSINISRGCMCLFCTLLILNCYLNALQCLSVIHLTAPEIWLAGTQIDGGNIAGELRKDRKNR
jgi:hypothetical protein